MQGGTAENEGSGAAMGPHSVRRDPAGESGKTYEPALSFLDAHQIAPSIEETAKNRAPNVSMTAGDLP